MAKRKPGGKVPAVILVNPKFAHNVGAALRACSCFGIPQLIYTGDRIEGDLALRGRLPREERMKGYQDVEFGACDYPFERLPVDAVPIAVELRDGSTSLTHFVHPENAVYVFGPEDGSLTNVHVRHCHHFVVIPSAHCLNLAAAVNVVLYDRRAKRQLQGLEPVSQRELLREHRGVIG
jgi:tRNA(Leu) C34 or U34 (ribose-2'-O)-methylase TrmL